MYSRANWRSVRLYKSEVRENMELIRLNPDCISCLLRSRLEDFPEDTPREKQIEYMQRVLKALSETPKSVGAPVIVRTINQIQKEMFGYNKDFTHVKSHFNELMMKKGSRCTTKIRSVGRFPTASNTVCYDWKLY